MGDLLILVMWGQPPPAVRPDEARLLHPIKNPVQVAHRLRWRSFSAALDSGPVGLGLIRPRETQKPLRYFPQYSHSRLPAHARESNILGAWTSQPRGSHIAAETPSAH